MVLDKPLILDENPLIPIYHKLAQAIKEKIVAGEIKEGDYIPSEAQLEEMFRISRTTVRLAIAELCKEGLLERQRGRGTTVKKRKLMREFPGLASFTEETKRMGKTPRTELVSVEVTAPTEEISRMLKIEPGEQVVRLMRKRYVNEDLLGISESFFRKKVWDQLEISDPFLQLDNKSIYAYMENKGIELVWAYETIEGGLADKKLTRILDIKLNSALIILTRVVYGRNDLPVEVGVNKFIASKYKVSIMHKRYS